MHHNLVYVSAQTCVESNTSLTQAHHNLVDKSTQACVKVLSTQGIVLIQHNLVLLEYDTRVVLIPTQTCVLSTQVF